MQTWALLLDAYRELNAKKLFWITLFLSGAVVAAFAAVGINARGITFLWWEIEAPVNTSVIPAAMFYKFAFSALAIPIWLAWIASILGLVSTAGIIPDFIAGGAIELSLSKPIGRARLLLTKFVTGLLFMFLQVSVFSLAAFLVIGIRGDAWEPRLFLAIPIMVLFFSYLYSVCVLLGLITRSTVASLMLTLLFWFGVFGVNTMEGLSLMARETNAMRQEWLEGAVGRLKKLQEADAAAGTTNERREQTLKDREEQLSNTRKNGVTVRRVHTIALAVKTAAPKTQETIDRLQKVLLSPEDRDRFRPRGGDGPGLDFGGDDVPVNGGELTKRIEEAQLARPLWWVIGTSLGFEAVVLGIAAWVFARRDF